MPKTCELTDFERGEIVGLSKGGHSEREIMRILERPKTTVHDVIKKYQKEQQTSTAPRSGRPPILTTRNIRYLVNNVKEDHKQSIDEITE